MRSVGWVVATTVGLVVGGFVLHFPGSYGGLGTWDVGDVPATLRDGSGAIDRP